MWFPLFVDPRLTGLSGADPAHIGPWLAESGAVPLGSATDAAKTAPGDLIDFVGEAQGNPLVRVLDFVATSMSVVSEDRPADPDAGGATPEAQKLVRVLAATARDDLRSGPVADVFFMVGEDLPVVASLDRQFAGPGLEALLENGRYRVVAKVCEAVGPGEGISLLRRSILAATGLEGGRDMLAELAGRGADLAVSDPVVEGPALAVIPLAVFV